MAKHKELTQDDLRVLRKTVFTSDEEERIAKRKNAPKHRPYRISHVWDPERQKYVKVKRYKKRTKMTKKQLEEFYGHKWGQPAKVVTLNTTKSVHATTPKVKVRDERTTVTLYGLKMIWDDTTLRYKLAA